MTLSRQLFKPSVAIRAVLLLTNVLGLWLCLGIVALLRSPWHSPAMLVNQAAAVAFAVALCSVVLGGGRGRLLVLSGAANLLVVLGLLALAAWNLAKGAPVQSAAGFAALAAAIPAINVSWCFLSARQARQEP